MDVVARTFFALALALGVLGAATARGAEDEGLPLEGKTSALAFTVDEASWVSVTMEPGGDGFVFDLLGDLYRLPMSGGHAERITSGLGFDSQPVLSPDGSRIAFVSDRDGADNLWIADADGSDARKLTEETYARLISPVWTPDGQHVAVTHVARKVELRMFHTEGGSGVTLTQIGSQIGDEPEAPEGVGAAFSPDGRYVFFAEKLGSPDAPTDDFPATQIVRLDLDSGARLQVTRGEGGGFRPLVSPDGRLLVYGTRHETETGLRIRDLETGSDRWLTLPVQRDTQENFRPSSRGMLPGYAFTPDGSAIVLSAYGTFQRIAIADGVRSDIPFTADVELDIGPDLTRTWRVPEGPITATLVQDPMISPDGERIVASVLTRLYVKDGDAAPMPLTDADTWAFKPVYSPDGRWIAFVTWTANDGGHVWRMRANGRGRAQQLTDHAAFYTDLAWAPDGETLWAMRGNEWIRHQTFSEFGGLGTPLELVRLPADGGAVTAVMPAGDARVPHFGPDADRVYLSVDGALVSVDADGGDRRTHMVVRGPRGSRFSEEAPGAEEVRISPDGRHVLAHVNKQVWLIPLVRTGAGFPEVDVTSPSVPAVRLTDIGADYVGWADGGATAVWTIGRTVHRRPVASVRLREEEEEEKEEEEEATNAEAADGGAAEPAEEPFVPLDEHEAVIATRFEVTVPRSTPEGTLLLSGAHVITMRDGEAKVLRDADLLIDGNRIAALGARGELDVPAGTETIDLSGRWIVPGFIDTHAHWEFRTQDVIEPHTWSVVANLAYGVTSGLDVQTAFHDYFAYRDLIAAGMAVGQRAFMTGPGIFGVNDFQSYDAVHAYLRRYTDHYETPNIKSYLAGNRKQRQWVVLAAQDLGLLPTTEGGGDQRLDLTHAIDGMYGNEHNLPDTPIFEDVVELFARTRTAYTPTLIVQYNAQSMREWFFTRSEVHDDAKLQRFYPHNRLDELTRRRPGWQRDDAFLIADGAEAAGKIQRAGGLVGVGGHAELQGLGYHWEMWAYAMGGMTPAEILRAATHDAAHVIGAPEDLGTIEVGKLADMVVLDADPLADIRHTVEIDRVIQDGRVYDGDTLDQQWPEQRPLPPFWWWDASDDRYVPQG